MVSLRFDITLCAVVLFLLALLISYSGITTIIEWENNRQFEKRKLASRERLLEHQLNQIATIFYTISQFFQSCHKSETSFLIGMAKLMELLSNQLHDSSSTSQDESIKIYNLLKGYNYAISQVYVRDNEIRQKQIILNFDECSRQDLDEVIVPLLQMVLDKNLKVISYQRNLLMKSPIRIELSDSKPLDFKVKAFKIKKLEETSGDTCSLFQFKQNTVCTLSDGMGTGIAAARSSSFITHLTQRLLAVGIPIEMAVKSINSLLKLNQEESFATWNCSTNQSELL